MLYPGKHCLELGHYVVGIIVGVTSAFPVFLLSLLRSATLTLIALGTGDWFAFFRRAEASAKQARGTKNANK